MSLTPKQQIFCEEYIKSLNATEAAIKAGYSAKTARSVGSENLTKPDIQTYIQERTSKAQNERIADAKEVLEYLSETMRDKDETRRERTKAAELLGKRYGIWQEQSASNIDGKINLTVNLENCSGEGDNES